MNIWSLAIYFFDDLNIWMLLYALGTLQAKQSAIDHVLHVLRDTLSTIIAIESYFGTTYTRKISDCNMIILDQLNKFCSVFLFLERLG